MLKCQKKDPSINQPTKPYTHPYVGQLTQILNLQTELKYLDLFKCYNILTDLGGGHPSLWMGVVGGWVCGWVWVYGGAWMNACTYVHAC